jgi:tetratricopeptide (TPR) repeat protein
MNVIVSGVAARVIFVSGAKISYIDAERPLEEKTSSRAALPYLLADAYDAESLTGVTREQAFAVLLTKWNVDRSLRMLQIIIDPDEDVETREQAGTYLSSLLSRPDVQHSVENSVFALAFPEGTHVESFEAFYWRNEIITEFVGKLISHQSEIAKVRSAWDELPDDLFEDPESRRRCELTAISKGVFRQLAEGLKDTSRLESAIANSYLTLKSERNFRAVIQGWTRGFADRKTRRRTLHNVNEDQLTDETEYETAKHFEKAHERYVSVTKQKHGIVEQISKGNDDRARTFAQQLVKWQLQNGPPEFASKSLCALAQEARRLGRTNLQLEWLEWATTIAPEDPWAHNQAGDAYFTAYRFTEAFQHYEKGVRYGMGRRGELGQAKVLAATGHLDEALQKSRIAIDRYHSDPDVHRSYAQYSEILRKMWRLEEALQSYNEAIGLFPTESVLYCGRAAVLTDMSRFSEALEAYDDILSRFPGEVVAWAGRADVLKHLGELDSALDAYEEAIKRFPHEAIPAGGRADVLRTMGRLDEALAAYRAIKEEFPFDPAAYSGIGEVHRELERFDLAIAAYQEAVSRFEFDVRARNGYANVLKAAGRYEDALREYDRIVWGFKYDIVGHTGRAGLLKALGSYEEALEAYDRILTQRPDYSYARIAKAAIYAIQGNYEKSLALLPNRPPETHSEWIAYHIRGMVYLKRNEIDAALDVFNVGVVENPFHQSRRYFENALAATKVRLRQYQEAINHVRETDTDVSRILKLHAFSALGRLDDARKELIAVNDNVLPHVAELRDEIAANFGVTERIPMRDMEWIIERESEVLLQAA